MIHAERGVGKTHIALGIAYAVATGGEFLGWSAPVAREVLFVDGEMPAEATQERLAKLAAAGPDVDALLHIFSHDIQDAPMPSLSTHEGRILITGSLLDTELLILDNISALVGGDENDADSWTKLQEWLLELRRLGVATLLIHHSGKGGQQRGTSKREDILDVSMKLARPRDYRFEQGARFEVHFEKARGLFGDDVEPFEARLVNSTEGCLWETAPVKQRNRQLVVAAKLERPDDSVRQLAERLGISKTTVGRHLKEARGDGEIK